MTDVNELDIMNKHAVGLIGEKIGMLAPPINSVTRDEALILAAWLVALADPGSERFSAILKRVQNT